MVDCWGLSGRDEEGVEEGVILTKSSTSSFLHQKVKNS